MATLTTNTVIAHGNNSEFRTWIQELNDHILVGGQLINTSDTGQLDLATANRPGTNTDAGRRIYRFNDTQQATAPIYFSVGFGTGSATAIPRISVTVGTGSDGAGSITGAIVSSILPLRTVALSSTTTPYLSYSCARAGFFGLIHKRGATPTAGLGGFMIERVPGSDGEPTADGISIIASAGGGSLTEHWMWRRVAPLLLGPLNVQCLPAGDPTVSSRPGGQPGAWRHFVGLPDTVALRNSMTVLASEVIGGATFTARPLGTVDGIYIGAGNVFPAPWAPGGGGGKYSLAMRFE